MQGKDLYSQILGIQTPWFVEDIQLDLPAGKVEIWVALQADARLTCPSCDQVAPRYDRRELRWRHLDTCQMQTILVADVPRVNCRTHGVVMMAVPWAEPGSGFTAMFEALVIDWLKISTTARSLG